MTLSRVPETQLPERTNTNQDLCVLEMRKCNVVVYKKILTNLKGVCYISRWSIDETFDSTKRRNVKCVTLAQMSDHRENRSISAI